MLTSVRNALAAAMAALALATTAAAPGQAAPAKLAIVPAKPVIHIENFSFTPPKITVKAGTTVTWINGDDIPHNIVARNGAFRSKVLDTNDSFSFQFPKSGTYLYFCCIHPHMVGQVIVTN